MAQDPSGWLDGVGRFDSPLFGGYPDLAEDAMYPQAIVLHVAQGTFQGLLNMARSLDGRASWHVSAGRLGERAQHVSIWDAAWHAGIVSNPLPEARRLMNQYGPNPNRWSIGIEMEGFSVDPGYSYDYVYSVNQPWPAQLISGVILTIEQVRERCQWLKELSGEAFAERIITHSHIDQTSRRNDPGALFMDQVMPVIKSHFTRTIEQADLQGPEPTIAQDIQAAKEHLRAAMRALGG